MSPRESAAEPRKSDSAEANEVRPGGRSARVSAAVMSATLELLAVAGVSGVSIGEVAVRSGVHRTSIYRRWGTKEALILAALKARAANAVAPPDLGSLRADLELIVRDVAAMLSEPRSLRVIRGLVAISDDQSDDARREYWGERFRSTKVVVERAVSRGELDPNVDAAGLLELLIAPLWMRLLVGGGEIDDLLLERAVTATLAVFQVRAPTD